ncbi:hypothetical protein QQF64_028649 [Cirrhinus molitorella]|uniref:Uncharacterized protein n=1 Tax=Cirrhinus molitorella TaxID=172907 RepID=A0ABR3N7K6_9TELE
MSDTEISGYQDKVMYSPDKYQPRGGTPLSPPETCGIAPFSASVLVFHTNNNQGSEPRKEQPEVSPLIKHLYPQGKACPVPATRANSGLAEGGPFEVSVLKAGSNGVHCLETSPPTSHLPSHRMGRQPRAAITAQAGSPGTGSEADGVWKLTRALRCDRVTCNQRQHPARLIMTVLGDRPKGCEK